MRPRRHAALTRTRRTARRTAPTRNSAGIRPTTKKNRHRTSSTSTETSASWSGTTARCNVCAHPRSVLNPTVAIPLAPARPHRPSRSHARRLPPSTVTFHTIRYFTIRFVVRFKHSVMWIFQPECYMDGNVLILLMWIFLCM
ncbi:hypothetical protein O3G_MSEX004542 [Manduca sexta]|uniref:Uncharacterized protein n=1 Tax=Manduca sexta TaxID=7130 RepID=A0A922CHU2_MANSE|nr:hypothetical protein O3G_MSEX004542 [Manduca sexta]